MALSHTTSGRAHARAGGGVIVRRISCMCFSCVCCFVSMFRDRSEEKHPTFTKKVLQLFY